VLQELTRSQTLPTRPLRLVVWADVVRAAARERKSFVYIVGESTRDPPFKIGFAGNPVARLQDLQIGNPRRLFLVGAAVCSCRAAPILEERAHEFLSRCRLGGEWFEAPKAMVDAAIQSGVNAGIRAVPVLQFVQEMVDSGHLLGAVPARAYDLPLSRQGHL
jgi:hypothetical protein